LRFLPAAVVVALACALAAAACDPSRRGGEKAAASDEWVRSYPLADGGELQLVGARGSVVVTGTGGSGVEIRAERVARAATEASARELLPRIGIREDVTPDRIVLQTEGLSGIVIGVEVAVNYHVTLPASARLHVRTDGDVTVSGMAGRAVVASTNGTVAMKGITGGVEVRAVNGNVSVDLAALGPDPVELRSTNGDLVLNIPRDSNAYLLANFTNGKIGMEDVTFQPVGEQTGRRVRGRINAGGTPIELTTVNGNIQLHQTP
jgi:hypothetical protein